MGDHKEDDWADHINEAYYDKMGVDFGRRTRDRINWMASQASGSTVLDVGCSQGITCILLAREGFDALGIDIYPQAVEYALKERDAEIPAVQRRLSFECTDLSALGPDRLFDTVIAGEVAEHQTNPERFLRKALSHLKPGGRIVVTAPFGLHPWPDHKCTIFPDDVAAAIGDECEILQLDVSAGYIRCVGSKRPGEKVSSGAILHAMRDGCLESQRALYEERAASEQAKARLKAATDRLAARDLELSKASERLADSVGQAAAERSALASDLQESRRSMQAMGERLDSATVALRQKQQELASCEERFKEASGRLDAAAVQLQEAQSKRDGHWRQLSAERLRSAQLVEMIESLHRENETYRTSAALALGRAMLAAKSPRGLAALPRAVMAALRLPAKRKAGLIPNLPSPLADLPASAVAAPSGMDGGSKSSGALSLPSPATPLPVVGWRREIVAGKAQVFSILDEFSGKCFAPHANLIEPRPDNWKALSELRRPDFALVESSWKGNAGSWQYRVAAYANPPGKELEELVSDFRSRGIPTVFWNKEDPVHFENFIDSASNFDLILTTAEEAVERYRERTDARVEVMPFAAETSLHNPIGSAGRMPKACFAGSFYANRFEDRQADQLMLLDAGSAFDLDIYDRNYGAAGAAVSDFSFPERFAPFIRGRLPYAEMNRAYRRYRVFLNVNSVIDSPTMFSRRVFELLACGTPIVSTWSRGIEEFFGDSCVWMVRSREEGEHAIRTLLEDDAEWRRRSLAGIRSVMNEHTFAHRFDRLLELVGAEHGRNAARPSVLIVGEAATDEELAHLLANVDRQENDRYDMQLAIVARSPQLAAPDRPALFVRDADAPVGAVAGRIAADANATHVCVFEGKCVYGRHFIGDLLHASGYSGAQIVGKPAEGSPEYAYGVRLNPAARLFALAGLSTVDAGIATAIDDENAAVMAGARLFAADAANFAAPPGRAPVSGEELSEVLAKIEI